MIKIAVCDDIKEVSVYIKRMLQAHDFEEDLKIDNFTSGDELLTATIKEKYDIVFLDIELSEDRKADNGMAISNKIKNVYPEVIIIFFTGNVGYEQKLLSFEPFRFIKKPIEESKLIEAVNSAIKRLKGWEEKYYSFKVNGITVRINLKEIIAFISRSPYIVIKTIEEDIELREKIDNIEKSMKILTDDFVRINKSFLVNKSFIKIFSSKEIILINGEKITISRKYLKKFMDEMKK